MSKKLLEDLLTAEQINNVIEFYLAPNSLNATVRQFDFINSRPGLVGLLLRNNITLHEQNIFLKKRNDYSIETTRQKYGVEHISQSDVVKSKIKQTNLEKYGVENVFAASIVKEKIKQTNIEHFGVENPGQRLEHSSLVKQTCLKKYENENYRNSEKTKQTCLKKYGVEYISQAKDIKDKVKQTNLERYGAEYFSQTLEFHKKARKLFKYNNETFDSLPELAVYLYAIINGINIRRNPVKFEYYLNNKLHYYLPDFDIDGKLVEIKGDHFFKEDGTMCNPFDHSQDELYEAKHQCGLNNNVEFWKLDDYNFAIEWFNAKGYKREDFLNTDIMED